MNILCFGDSNTYGYDPRDVFGGCYDKPWPQILAERSGWSIQNRGENGREIPLRPVSFPKNINLLITMLGTNDLLQGNSVETAAQRMESFLQNIDLEKEKLLLIAPPSMKLGAWVSTQNIVEASRELTHAYHGLSQRLGIRFANADSWNIPLAFDGVHFTEDGHRTFALALDQYLNKGD
jgi:lysophospholipase L1-like esterase